MSIYTLKNNERELELVTKLLICLALWYPSSKLLDLKQLLLSHTYQFTRMVVCRSRNLPSIYFRIRCKHNFQCYFHCWKEMLPWQHIGLLGKTEVSASLLIKSQLVRQFLQILDVKFWCWVMWTTEFFYFLFLRRRWLFMCISAVRQGSLMGTEIESVIWKDVE